MDRHSEEVLRTKVSPFDEVRNLVQQDEKRSMEPNTLVNPSIQAAKPPFIRRKWVAVVHAALLLFVWWCVYSDLFPTWERPIHYEKPDGTKLWDFDEIIPSEKLEWHPCFNATLGLQCARLTVPMDYHRPLNESKDNPKVHIALILAPGKHTGEKKVSTSPLILNPGGPGGSGVQLVRAISSFKLRETLGEDQDIVGFDPRGIGATMPRADCFSYGPDGKTTDPSSFDGGEDYATGNFHRTMWQLSGLEVGLANSTSGSLQKLDARARTLGKLCQEKDSVHGKDSILKYVHTPSVARDMISIVDAWDEWTESLGKKSRVVCNSENEVSPKVIHKKENLHALSHGTGSFEATNAGTYSLDTKGKLVYWGFSYGTLLGATFASMFPDRVGRVILDGVVDADLYVSPIWSDSIRDTDTISDSFAKYCQEAGQGCALYRKGDTVKDINDRFYGLLESLKDRPITGVDKRTMSPVVINHSQIKALLFSTLYLPTVSFPAVAYLFDLLYREQRDFLATILGGSAIYDRNPLCASPLPSWTYPSEAQAAIMCSDKRYPLNESIPNLEERFQKLSKVSFFADVWITIMLGCDGWRIEAVDPPMRWDDHPAHKSKPIKTAFPVLFIGNTADPVTPLFAAVKMAKKFKDAGLIEQHSEGHCSLAAVSKCTIHKIRDYIREGKVPPPPKEGTDLNDGVWDKCDADEWPFHPYNGDEYITKGGAEVTKEAEMMNAMKEMQGAFRKFRFYGQPEVLPEIVPLGFENQL